MDEIGSAHDRYFRESFGRVEVARDFLHHNLPADLLALVDLETLEVSSETHVAEDLRESCSDLVYRLAWHNGGGLEVYVLFEHKSRPEHWTLLTYFLSASAHLDEGELRTLLTETPIGETAMQTLAERYRDQAHEMESTRVASVSRRPQSPRM